MKARTAAAKRRTAGAQVLTPPQGDRAGSVSGLAQRMFGAVEDESWEEILTALSTLVGTMVFMSQNSNESGVVNYDVGIDYVADDAKRFVKIILGTEH